MAQQPFDPNQYLSKVKGRDYLEVKWRIAWMRSEHPDAVLETDLMSHDETRAIVRARVSLPEGGSATGWGSETVDSSEAYIEKAETKAIGRALTALGYGTPVSTESEFQEAPRQQVQVQPRQRVQNTQSKAHLATPPQRARIQRLATELNLDEPALTDLIQQHTGNNLTTINKRQASGIIDLLESRRPVAQQVS